jgi:hypothetical protein
MNGGDTPAYEGWTSCCNHFLHASVAPAEWLFSSASAAVERQNSHKYVHHPLECEKFVIWVVFFVRLVYNKNVIKHTKINTKV